jgi:glyoxylase-like metal-dependent hydrolase (beta-lactamase superfamily II)
MTHAPAQEILPGIILGICPLPPGWNLDVAMVLACGARLAVIDTGVAEFMPGALAPALAACARTLDQVSLIVNTHAHWDHVQGNAAIRAASGAPVCIPAPEAATLEGGADRLLVDEEILDLGGGLRFTVIATPGHSPGMACLYAPESRVLIVSDAVQGYGPPGTGLPLYFHSGRQYRASLERLVALDGDVLVLGHPFVWSGPARFVHRGADARRFLAESRTAAAQVAAAVERALAQCPERQPACVDQALVSLLAAEPRFGLQPGQRLSRLAEGTIASELADRGLG